MVRKVSEINGSFRKETIYFATFRPYVITF